MAANQLLNVRISAIKVDGTLEAPQAGLNRRCASRCGTRQTQSLASLYSVEPSQCYTQGALVYLRRFGEPPIAGSSDIWRSTIALDKRSAKSFIRINDRSAHAKSA